MFRIGGNIYLDNSEIINENSFKVNVGPKQNCISFIQYLKPLTRDNPCFEVKLLDLKNESSVTVGIASLDINETVHPGSWNNTIGYESQSGKCICSHKINANTLGRPVKKDDTLGFVVTYFGKNYSTVLFLVNNEPISTRYHFENDHDKFLPTVTLENGPIDLEIRWPDMIKDMPAFVNKSNSVTWIKPLSARHDAQENLFENLNKSEDMPLQSSLSLSRLHPHYKCIQLDVSPNGQGSSAGIATCSPLKPTPTCSLLRDYYTWLPKMKLKQGSSIGWGIFYNPETPNLDDKAEQLALVFVTFNSSIVDVLFVLQPEGGFYPLVLMQPFSTKVKLEFDLTISVEDRTRLAKLFISKYSPSLEIFNSDKQASTIDRSHIQTSSDIIQIKFDRDKTIITLPSSHQAGLYFIQYRKALTQERRFFFAELNKLSVKSTFCIGISSSIEHDNLLGSVQDTVGYRSKDGLLWYNGKTQGNMLGKKYSKGDTVGLEIEAFDRKMSVALFSKNFKPVGTRFLTAKNQNEFYPTFSLMTNGEPIEFVVYFQNKVSTPPHFNVRNPEDWCTPEGTKIDPIDKTILLPHHYDHSLCIQAPYSLHHKYNHFEIVLVDDFDKNSPPPAIALCTACPFDPPPVSHFKQDYLRFWPHGEAMSAVKKNDRLGWGIFYPDENSDQDAEQLVICYLTINRQVSYLRVLFQPPGGFYPVVIAPPNVYRIKLDFLATRVSTQDFTGDQVKQIIEDSRKQIEEEQKLIADGLNPRLLSLTSGEHKVDSKQSKTCIIL